MEEDLLVVDDDLQAKADSGRSSSNDLFLFVFSFGSALVLLVDFFFFLLSILLKIEKNY